MSAPAILFVCLGNICRSPLAEAALRRRVQAARLDWFIDSAGTGNWHAGKAPDRRAIAEAARHGIDISGYRARQVVPGDFQRFTHVLALDAQNLADLVRFVTPGTPAQLALLLDYVPGMAGQAVADPYWGEAADFARTWDQVDQAAAELVAGLARAPQ